MPRRARSSSFAKRRRIRNILVVVVIAAIIIASSVFIYYEQILKGHIAPNATGSASDLLTSQPIVSQYVTEFPTQPNASPNAIAVDSGGNVWFSMESYTSIAELNPGNGSVHMYPLPESKNATVLCWGIAIDNANGIVWFTDQFGNSVWKFNVNSHVFTKYPLPNSDSSPYQIALDQKGNTWFTELDGDRLGEITTRGTMEEFKVPLTSTYNAQTGSTGPAGIAISKDGTVWFAESYGNSIGSFANGNFKQYDLSNEGLKSPTGIAVDQQGNLWITQHGASFLSEFSPLTDHLTTISTSVVGVTTSLPYFVQIDSAGNVWFNEHYGNAIARYTPSNSSLVEYLVPSRVSNLGNIAGVLTLALSPHGTPWFTELYTGKIGTINVTESIDLGIRLTGQYAGGNVIDIPGGKILH